MVRLGAALTTAAASKALFSVNATLPTDRQKKFPLGAVYINQNFLDKRPHDAFLQLYAGTRVGPNRFELSGKLVKVSVGANRRLIRGRTMLLNAHLDLMHLLQRQIPAPLQFRGDQAVFRIGCIVLSSRSVGGIYGSLSITLQCFQYIVLLADTFFLSQQGSLDRRRLNHAKYLSADRFIDGDTTERNATGFTVIQKAYLLPSLVSSVCCGTAHRSVRWYRSAQLFWRCEARAAG